MLSTGFFGGRELSEKCAVFGAYGVTEAARAAFYGLWALQHRGQESSGIVSADGMRLYRHTGTGLVANAYHEEDLEQLAGHVAIGHNRYSTSGGAGDHHSQPFWDRDLQFAFAHNGNLPTTDKLARFLETKKISTERLNDSAMMAAAIRYFISQGKDIGKAVIAAFPLFEGAFSAVAMTPHTLVAFRDHCGIRPLVIGQLGDGYIIASETCALDTIGATFLQEVRPGQMVIIDSDGIRTRQITPGRSKLDIFEFVYFARPDSKIMGRSVNEVRENFGKQLAREYPLRADMVIPVPDSAIPAAQGYARASGLPLEMALIKNRYIHRTFIRPTAALRERDLQMKLNPIPEVINNKRVIIVDDSIVRGTTTKKIVRMVRQAGAREVHVLISSPPVKYPDFYGINTPVQKDLIAARMSVKEITAHMGADSLNYLSYDGMIKATSLPADAFSTSCFNGVYPVAIGERAKEFVKL